MFCRRFSGEEQGLGLCTALAPMPGLDLPDLPVTALPLPESGLLSTLFVFSMNFLISEPSDLVDEAVVAASAGEADAVDAADAVVHVGSSVCC